MGCETPVGGAAGAPLFSKFTKQTLTPMENKAPPKEHAFGELLGLVFKRVEEGHSVCALQIRPELLNPYRVLHGGVLFSMADTGMGAALYSRMVEAESCATIEIKMNFLRPVSDGMVTCESRVVQKGKRVAVLESDLSCEGRVVAKALGTFSIFERRTLPEGP